MDSITQVSISPLENSEFIRPLKFHYNQNGNKKEWHLLKIHDSVCILIFNTTRRVLVLVKQFRPAVYYASIPSCDQTTHIDTDKYPSKLGITIELCAGIVDKELPLEEIASIEILEECGYDVPASKLETITTYRSGIGTSGDKQTMFYVEVTDQMKIGSGGGNPKEGELIEVVEMSISEATRYMAQDEVKSPGGFMFALMWFFHNKVHI